MPCRGPVHAAIENEAVASMDRSNGHQDPRTACAKRCNRCPIIIKEDTHQKNIDLNARLREMQMLNAEDVARVVGEVRPCSYIILPSHVLTDSGNSLTLQFLHTVPIPTTYSISYKLRDFH